jgi:hypothetical protein
LGIKKKKKKKKETSKRFYEQSSNQKKPYFVFHETPTILGGLERWKLRARGRRRPSSSVYVQNRRCAIRGPSTRWVVVLVGNSIPSNPKWKKKKGRNAE